MINNELIEQLAEGLQKCDITENYSLEHKSDVPDEMQFIMDKIRMFFGQYWKDNLKELGIKETMQNYSKVYPINLLEKADVSMFEGILNDIVDDSEDDEDDEEFTEQELEQIADLFGDFNLAKLGELFLSGDEEPENVMLKTLLEHFQKCVDIEFEKTTEMLGIPKEEMTDEEKLNVWNTAFDKLNKTGIQDLMLGQRVPEIFGISKKNGAIEDFSNKKENHSKIDFLRKQYWLRRKFDCMLSFDELTEEDLISFSEENDAFKVTDEEIDKAVSAFVDTLDDTDREIYFMKQDGYTQEEIAEALGYKTHSAVTKRLAKMREKAEKIC